MGVGISSLDFRSGVDRTRVCEKEVRKERKKGRKEESKAKSTRQGCGVEGVRLIIVLLNKTRGIGSPGTEVKLFFISNERIHESTTYSSKSSLPISRLC